MMDENNKQNTQTKTKTNKNPERGKVPQGTDHNQFHAGT
jgi:hypothetical protein